MLVFMMILIDQIIKYYVYINRPEFNIIPKWLGITYAENTGTVFGFAQGSNLILMLIAFSILIVLSFIIIKNKKRNKYSYKQKLLKIILAGGISNLNDRVCRGFVIDYVSLKFFGVCNLADFCIVVGITLLVIEEIKDLIKNK